MNTDTSRRSFLKFFPLAAVFATIGGAAFRFLRPRLSAVTDAWLDVAPVAELTGPQPISRKVLAEQISGWAITTEEHNVFVLPAKNNQVGNLSTRRLRSRVGTKHKSVRVPVSRKLFRRRRLAYQWSRATWA